MHPQKFHAPNRADGRSVLSDACVRVRVSESIAPIHPTSNGENNIYAVKFSALMSRKHSASEPTRKATHDLAQRGTSEVEILETSLLMKTRGEWSPVA